MRVPPKFAIRNLTYGYSGQTVLNDVSLDIPPREIFVLLGPANSGKSTLLRLLNRLNDMVDEPVEMSGQILLDGEDIYRPEVQVTELRRRVGIVFARPLPLPGTVWENITYGLTLRGERDPLRLDGAVQRSLQQAALWDEVRDRLHDQATRLSGGQQQRLCLARVLALEPDVVLLDEPTSGLDPISTAKVEESLHILKKDYTFILSPHSIQQAARMADRAAFLLMGELVETGPAGRFFTAPEDKRTEDYLTGRFG